MLRTKINGKATIKRLSFAVERRAYCFHVQYYLFHILWFFKSCCYKFATLVHGLNLNINMITRKIPKEQKRKHWTDVCIRLIYETILSYLLKNSTSIVHNAKIYWNES